MDNNLVDRFWGIWAFCILLIAAILWPVYATEGRFAAIVPEWLLGKFTQPKFEQVKYTESITSTPDTIDVVFNQGGYDWYSNNLERTQYEPVYDRPDLITFPAFGGKYDYPERPGLVDRPRPSSTVQLFNSVGGAGVAVLPQSEVTLLQNDNLQLGDVIVSPVPLPGAFWFIVSGFVVLRQFKN